MSWLEPKLEVLGSLPVGRVRTVSHEKAAADRESKKRRYRRWWFKKGKALKKTEKYRAKRRAWVNDNQQHLREYQRAYYTNNREAVLHRQRMYYATNEKRRTYLREKQREYRLRKKLKQEHGRNQEAVSA